MYIDNLLFSAGLLVILFLGWIYYLKKEVKLRKNSEKQLRQNKMYICDIHKYALIGDWKIDPDGRCCWSEEVFHLFGLSCDKKAGFKLFASIASDEDVKAHKALVETTIANQSEYSFQCKITRANDNQPRWVHIRGKACLDNNGKLEKISGFVQDITEQKAAIAKLQETQNKYRAMFETALIGMALNDNEGNLLEVNQAYLDIVGYSAEEIKQLNFWDLTPQSYLKEEQSQLNSLKK